LAAVPKTQKGGAMKYDLNRNMTRSAARILAAFTSAMAGLASEKPFEEITVQELCAKAGYPRATFYNYFDDKYDLLDYCWYALTQQLGLQELESIPEAQRIYIYFDRLYDLLDRNRTFIAQVLRHNNAAGYLVSAARTYVEKIVREAMQRTYADRPSRIPLELLAGHYSNTLVWILEWCMLMDKKCSREQAHSYLHAFLDGIINE
jgi:AcrR family transcriptional regulator